MFKKVLFFSLFAVLVNILFAQTSSYTVTFSNVYTTDILETSTDHYTINVHLPDNTTAELSMVATANSAIISEVGGGVLYSNSDIEWPTQTNGYPGDRNQLGPRRNGESFGDCVWRNFTNFCCDFIGCLAATTATKEVLAACALVCSVSTTAHGTIGGGEIVKIHNNITNTDIYNRE